MTRVVIGKRVNMASWGIAALKAKASEVVERAQKKGPQEITKNGKPVAVIVGIADYRQSRMYKPKESLVGVFRRSPAYGIAFEAERLSLKPRKVEF
jgi:prevent-host-death family protein